MNPAYVSPIGFHRHKCAFCAYVWEHHNINDNSHGDYGAHECPSCHRCNWSLGIYDGDQSPQIRNGKIPITGQDEQTNLHPDQRKLFNDRDDITNLGKHNNYNQKE